MTLNELYRLAEDKGIDVSAFPLPESGSLALELDGRQYIGMDSSRRYPAGEEAPFRAAPFAGAATVDAGGDRYRQSRDDAGRNMLRLPVKGYWWLPQAPQQPPQALPPDDGRGTSGVTRKPR